MTTPLAGDGFGAMLTAPLSTFLRGKPLPALGYAWIIAMLPWFLVSRLQARFRAGRPDHALPVSYVVALASGVLLTIGFDLLLLWSAGPLISSVL